MEKENKLNEKELDEVLKQIQKTFGKGSPSGRSFSYPFRFASS